MIYNESLKDYVTEEQEEDKEKLYERLHHIVYDFIVKPRDEVFEDSELLRKALEEAEKRKEYHLKMFNK